MYRVPHKPMRIHLAAMTFMNNRPLPTWGRGPHKAVFGHIDKRITARAAIEPRITCDSVRTSKVGMDNIREVSPLFAAL
jgi:hypothetical protein